MIAKCGTQRVHHWAHRGERACDAWWEPETPWHRDWKSRFPADWREVIRFSQSGEKHIADVRTEHGLTIEFQHSHLKPDERAAREAFYGNMMWVVVPPRPFSFRSWLQRFSQPQPGCIADSAMRWRIGQRVVSIRTTTSTFRPVSPLFEMT